MAEMLWHRINEIFIYLITFFRVVADDQRSFALGLQSSIFRVFGSIPGPLLFGAIFDSVCLKWEDVCGRNGNCWIYDNVGLSRGSFYLALPCVFVSAVLSFLAWVFYPKNADHIKGSSRSSESLEDASDHSPDSDSDTAKLSSWE